MSTLSLKQIRIRMYYDQRETFRSNNEDMDNYWKYPYSFFKARIYIECAAVFVSILQRTNVQPNHLTVLYAMLGPISVGLVFLGNQYAYFFALLNFFLFKAILDWSDGALARIKNNCTSVGAVLDPWGAVVNSYSFQISILLYTYNGTSEMVFLYIALAITYFRAIDLKDFNSSFLGRTVVEGQMEKGKVNNKRGEVTSIQNNSRLMLPFKIGTLILDDRARMVDSILLVLFLEGIFLEGFLISRTVCTLLMIGILIRFVAGMYLVYFGKTYSRISN